MPLTIFWQFFILGCLAFGGPAAHISYFQNRFVQQLAWLDNDKFAQLNALCTLLPGPSSSQLGFAIGLHKGGITGGLAAFLGFTTPSFFLMASAAMGVIYWEHSAGVWNSVIAAMKLFAVVVVADASAGMMTSLCLKKYQWLIMMVTTIAFLAGMPAIGIILVAGLLGGLFHRDQTHNNERYDLTFNRLAVLAFLLLLLLSLWQSDAIFSAFYLIGSSVFGGGHVMLPMLLQQFAQTLSSTDLLSAYALAQAIPGPMFTAASYLGVVIGTEAPWSSALFATLGIFAPGLLLILAFFKHWEGWQQHARIVSMINYINPTMVGLLMSSLLGFIIPSSIYEYSDLLLIAIAAVLLAFAPRGLLFAAGAILLAKLIGF